MPTGSKVGNMSTDSISVDMSIPYGDPILGHDSNYGSIRDSFYLLQAMNQYTMQPSVRQKKQAEGLLRIVLFSKDLQLLKSSNLDSGNDLNSLRQQLAKEMRDGRKRGVVPVYISTGWFLFSLALSIQSAFGLVGQNATAHDLALGCLLAWLPVLILSSIVDRNPVAADEIKSKLNRLIDRVRLSLMNESVRSAYLGTIHNKAQQQKMRDWVGSISSQCLSFGDEFFVEFAGQGRVRHSLDLYRCATWANLSQHN